MFNSDPKRARTEDVNNGDNNEREIIDILPPECWYRVVDYLPPRDAFRFGLSFFKGERSNYIKNRAFGRMLRSVSELKIDEEKINRIMRASGKNRDYVLEELTKTIRAFNAMLKEQIEQVMGAGIENGRWRSLGEGLYYTLVNRELVFNAIKGNQNFSVLFGRVIGVLLPYDTHVDETLLSWAVRNGLFSTVGILIDLMEKYQMSNDAICLILVDKFVWREANRNGNQTIYIPLLNCTAHYRYQKTSLELLRVNRLFPGRTVISVNTAIPMQRHKYLTTFHICNHSFSFNFLYQLALSRQKGLLREILEKYGASLLLSNDLHLRLLAIIRDDSGFLKEQYPPQGHIDNLGYSVSRLLTMPLCRINNYETADWSVMDWAAALGSLECLRFACEQIPSIYSGHNVLNYPLFFACIAGHTACVEYLFNKYLSENNAELPLPRYQGYNLLGFACLQGDVDCARILLAHGANPDEVDKRGISPRQIALDSRNDGLIAEFNRHPPFVVMNLGFAR